MNYLCTFTDGEQKVTVILAALYYRDVEGKARPVAEGLTRATGRYWKLEGFEVN